VVKISYVFVVTKKLMWCRFGDNWKIAVSFMFKQPFWHLKHVFSMRCIINEKMGEKIQGS